MKMFRFCIEGAEDLNRNGLPEIKVSAQVLGFTIIDESVDVSIEQAFKSGMKLLGELGVIKK